MPFTLGVLLVCVATYSVTRLLIADTITDPLRARLERWAAEGIADLDRHRTPTRKSRIGAWLVELATCGWCAGMYVGLALSLCWWAALPSLPAPLFWVPTVAFVARCFAGFGALVVAWVEKVSE